MHQDHPFTVGDPRDGIECVAFLSTNPATNRAFVFVHGFNGEHDPRQEAGLGGRARGGGTFRGFEDAIRRDPRFAAADAYFVGYKSVLDDTHVNAARVLAFLKGQLRLHPSRGGPYLQHVNDPTLRAQGRELRQAQPYEHLVLVAHSEGGVVVRKAIMRAWREWESPSYPVDPVVDLVLRSELVLFAPAQGGTRMGGLIALFEDVPILKGAARALKAFSPAYYDLTSESIGLDQLRSQTEAPKRRQFSAARARTLWAADDRVVEAVDYTTDHPSMFLRYWGHGEVCKPDDGRRRAIMDFLFDMPPQDRTRVWGAQ